MKLTANNNDNSNKTAL